MALLPIRLYPDPILLRPTEPVAEVDEEVRRLAEDMLETMVHAPGIGLAANQVGISRRICVVDLSFGQDPGARLVFVNPQILEVSGSQVGEEGCLSFPGITLDIDRGNEIRVESLDANGASSIIAAEGLLARAILHECEHLDGKTFLRNVSSLKRELIKRQIRKQIKSGDWTEAAAK